MSRKPRLLDAFCGAGGAARGYVFAGFDVRGCDHVEQPNYLRSGASAFVRADAIEFIRDHGHEFDVIHASPPCPAYSAATRPDRRAEHPDLVGPTRELLAATGKPWVMENVQGAPMRFAFMLCGSMFGMKVRRHRLFESSVMMFTPPCRHHLQPVTLSVTGTGYGGKHKRNGMKPAGIEEAREVMGVGWPMTIKELSNAIPPAYTRWIGERLLTILSTEERP